MKKTAPELFPARQEILQLCKHLRSSRDPALLLKLPSMTDARDTAHFHKLENNSKDGDRDLYFLGFQPEIDHVLLGDPDNGFEPERGPTEKHVCYADIDRIIKSISPGSMVTVFSILPTEKIPCGFRLYS